MKFQVSTKAREMTMKSGSTMERTCRLVGSAPVRFWISADDVGAALREQDKL